MSKEKNAGELKVELWPVEKIIPYKKNAKLHDEEQINRLAAIIEEFGFRQPIVVDDKGVILAGHGRRLAALKLGMSDIPVSVARGLTEKQKSAYRIADNMVSRGGFDEDLLGNEIMQLSMASETDLTLLDMSLLGMSDIELSDIFEKFSSQDIALLGDDDGDEPNDEDAFEPKALKTEDDNVEYEQAFCVVIDCSGENEQRELYDRFISEGRKCKVMTM